jgi:hypothetical protein
VGARRLQLLKQSLQEAREQIDFVIGDGLPPRLAEVLGAIDGRVQGVEAQLAGMTQALEEQRAQVREIAVVAAWHRRLLGPVVALWRRLHGRR